MEDLRNLPVVAGLRIAAEEVDLPVPVLGSPVEGRHSLPVAVVVEGRRSRLAGHKLLVADRIDQVAGLHTVAGQAVDHRSLLVDRLESIRPSCHS